MGSYVRSTERLERGIGVVGVILLCLSLVMHVFGTLPAYRYRNNDDSGALIALASSRVRVVVADDTATAQLLMPLYRRKIIFLADSPELVRQLATELFDQRVYEFVLVSRRPQDIALEPLRLDHADVRGRMLLKYYRR
jgi:hypothetical protein